MEALIHPVKRSKGHLILRAGRKFKTKVMVFAFYEGSLCVPLSLDAGNTKNLNGFKNMHR